MLICICGLPGSGKTYFAKHLAQHLGLKSFNTDALRDEIKQLGQYDENSRLAVYNEMAKRAKPLLLKQESLIIDGSFNNNQQRDIIFNLAAECDTKTAFIRCFADEQTSLERVSQKREYTEADTRVYYLLKELWEELELPHLSLDSSRQSLEERLEFALVFIDSRQAEYLD